MLTRQQILFGLFLPAAIAGTIFLLSWRPWRRGTTPVARAASALAIAVAYCISYQVLIGFTGFPPRNSQDWLVYLSLLAAALSLLDGPVRSTKWLRLAAVLLVPAVLAWLLIRPSVGSELSQTAAAGWIAGLTLLLAGWCVALERLAARVKGLSLPLVLLLTATGTAAVLANIGLAQRGGVAAGGLVAIFTAMIIAVAWRSRFELSGGSMLALTMLLPGLVCYAYFAVYPPPDFKTITSLVLLVLAPALAWLGELRWPRRRHWAIRAAVRLAPVAGLLAVAFALTIIGSSPPEY